MVIFIKMRIITPKQHFFELVRKWKDETGGYSTSYHKYKNKNYQQIIGMGIKVVPYIFECMQKDSDFWHHALVQILGENPIPNKAHGNLGLVCKLWLIWGKQKGLI